MPPETWFDLLTQDMERCSICNNSFGILDVVITESGEIVCKTCEKIRQMNQLMPNVPPPQPSPPLSHQI